MNLQELRQEVPYKWKIQSFNYDKTSGTCVAYIDARNAMDLLDKVCGPENWQDKYEVVGDRFVCSVGVKPDSEWVWKSDTGTRADFEAEKSEFSDAFKRACVKWGIGRFLYDMDIRRVKCKPEGKSAYPIDDSGQRIWDLTEYFNRGSKKPTEAPKTQEKKEPTTEELARLCTVCNARLTHASGTKDGKTWSGWRCPNSTAEKKHPFIFDK